MTQRYWLIVLASIVGSSAVMLSESVANLALPAIQNTFGAPFSSLQWVIEGYTLTLSAFILFGGSLGDSVGLRRMYLWSSVGFLLLSLICAFAWNMTSLIVFRAGLGVAGALLTPVSLAILNVALPRELRSRAIGLWTAWTTIALAGGPFVGGYLIDHFSWRAIFLLPVPMMLIGCTFVWYFLEMSQDKKPVPIDWFGVLLGFFGLGGVTYGLIEGPSAHWQIIPIFSFFVGFAVSVFFLYWEGVTKNPLIDLSLFKNRNFSAITVSTFLLYGALAGFGFVFAIFLQTKGGYSSTMTGLAFLPASLLLAILSGMVGKWAQSIGPKVFVAVGPFICAAGMVYMVPLSSHSTYLLNIFPGIILFGLGLALTVAPLTSIALSSAPESKSGIASAVNNGTASVGPLILIALLGLSDATHVYVFAVGGCAICAAGAGLVSYLFIKNPA